MTRGFYYRLCNGAYIDSAVYQVLSHQIKPGAPNEIDEFIDQSEIQIQAEISPVLSIVGVFVPDAPMNTMMRAVVWNQWTWHMTVTQYT